MQADGNLAMGRLAERARVLAREADRMLAFLRESGVIDDLGHRVGEGALQAFRHVLPQRFPLPWALAEELL